jgi:hypothetical protein
VDALGCLFRDDQFRRAIQAGSVAVLRDDIKTALLEAYFAMGSANSLIHAAWQHPKNSNPWAEGVNEASKRIREAEPRVAAARKELQQFLQPEPGSAG